MHAKPVRLVAVILSSLLLVACGGGGSAPPPGGTNPPAGNRGPAVEIAEQDPVMELTAVTLSATGEDADGDALVYTWTQTGGTPVELANTDSAELTFNAPKVKNSETLTFQVTVNDGKETASATIDVIVEEANGVVYAGIEEEPDVEHVYFHHPAFENPRRLSPETPSSAWVVEMQLAPDHKHVVYTLEMEEEGIDPIRLFVAALDGSSARDVSGDPTDGGRVDGFKVSPDGNWIAFQGDLETDGVEEIFVVRLDGSESRRKISGDIPADVIDGGISSQVHWSPDSTRLLFGGELRIDNRQEVFVASVSGGDRTLLSSKVNTQNRSDLFQRTDPAFAWSPDGKQIALPDQDVIDDPITLMVVSADGAVKREVIHADATASNDIRMAWSANSQLAFSAPVEGGEGNARELYLVTEDDVIAKGGASDIDDNGTNGPDGRITNFGWSPSGTFLDFRLERPQAESVRDGVFVVPVDAGEPVRIDGLTNENANVPASFKDAKWLPDGNALIFSRYSSTGQPQHYFSNNADNTALTDISGETTIFYNQLEDFHFSPGGGEIVFDARLETDGLQHVYVAATDGSGRRIVSGGGIPDDPGTGDVIEQSVASVVHGGFSPDGTQILFSGDLERDELEQLFIVPSDSVDGRDRIRVSNLLEQTNLGGNPIGVWRDAIWVGPDPE